MTKDTHQHAPSLILIIDDDDEFTKYIKHEIEHQFPGYRIEICHRAAAARQLLLRSQQQVSAVIFDSGFGKNKLAGCELYLSLLDSCPWLAARTLFHTAFDEEVHSELVRAGKLDEERLIGKSIDSLSNLNAALERVLSSTGS